MTYVFMTMHAFAIAMMRSMGRGNLLHEALVAMHTILLKQRTILGMYAYGLVEVLQSEALGMPETVFCLSDPFADEVVREMAVDTGSGSMVACLLPALVLFPHDVAVNAGFGIAAKVRQPFSVIDGVCPGAGAYSNKAP
jgi:hypothetical protein